MRLNGTYIIVYLREISEGDGIVCGASNDWKLIATGHPTSAYYIDAAKVFLKDGLFPDRFDFNAERVLPPNEIDVKPLLDRLSFVKDLAPWAVFFRNCIVEISQHDWLLISKLLCSTPVNNKPLGELDSRFDQR